MITVVGLGAEEGDLTENGKRAILGAKRVIARTALTRSYRNLAALGVEHTCLDEVYKRSRSFSTLNKNLAAEVAKSGDGTVYCVDGAASEDNSVRALKSRLRGKLRIIDGVSRVSALVRAAGFAECSSTAVSAYELAETPELPAPLVVYDMDDRALAGDVKLRLSDVFGEETEVLYISGGETKKIKLFELDRQNAYGYDSAVAVERIPLLEKKRFTLSDLKELVERLRRPDGCPWDRVQTPESIKMNAVEEAYELADAIESGDDDKVLEETGDILLQAVFHAVMKEESGSFDLADVTTGVCEKLITRHTHIFGKDKADGEAGALSVWEKNKMKEKHQETFSDAVNDVPKVFPALMQAQKVAKRVEKGGWGYADYESAEQKLFEEISELKAARDAGDKKEIASELGDVLMSAVNLGREVGADCEEALLDTVKKIKRRFTAYESAVLADGKDVNALSDEEKEAYYRAMKAAGEKGE